MSRGPEAGSGPAATVASGQAAWRAGRYQEALGIFEAAHGEQPADAGAALRLAQAAVALDRHALALASVDRALAAGAPPDALRYFRALLSFDDRDPGPFARETAALAARERSEMGLALAAMGATLAGTLEGPEPEFQGERARAAWAAFRDMHRRHPRARWCSDGPRLLARALAARPRNGLLLEFGVYHGRSLRQIAARVDGPVHGFDSFLGLPEDWKPGEPRGSYSTGGRLPEVPAQVELHPGWFEDTLPPFLENHPGPLAFAHVDCDLYSSTRTVLAALAGRMVEGTVLLFDDYTGFPGAEAHEQRAFEEFLDASPWEAEAVGFTLPPREAAFRLRRAS